MRAMSVRVLRWWNNTGRVLWRRSEGIRVVLRRREGTRPGRVRAMEVVGRAVKFVEEGARVWRRLPWRSVAAGETMRVHTGGVN